MTSIMFAKLTGDDLDFFPGDEVYRLRVQLKNTTEVVELDLDLNGASTLAHGILDALDHHMLQCLVCSADLADEICPPVDKKG